MLNMINSKIPRYISIPVVFISVFVISLYIKSCYFNKIAQSEIKKSAILEINGIEKLAKAEVNEEKAEAIRVKIGKRDPRIAQLEAQIDQLKRERDSKVEVEQPETALEVKQAELIQEQNSQIQDLKAENLELREGLKLARAAANDFRRQAVAERIARESQLAAAKSQRLQWGIGGIAIGVGASWGLGKLLK